MSTETWVNEFYPTPAEAVVTEEEAIKHSLRKWKGLTPGNLIKHGMTVDTCFSIDDSEGVAFPVSSDSCALCKLFLRWSEKVGDKTCTTDCPLVQTRGAPCDESTEASPRSPWGSWVSYRDPKPMIKLLEEALG